MHFLPWMDGRGESRMKTNSSMKRDWQSSWQGLLDGKHRFLIVFKQTSVDWPTTSLPFEKGRSFSRGAGSSPPWNGGWTSAEHGVERWRTRTKDVRCLPLSADPFVRSYSTGAEVKTKPLPPLSPVDLLSPVCHPPSCVNQG